MGLDIRTSGPKLQTIAGIDCHTEAWKILDDDQIESRAPKRRNNTLMPLVNGRRGNKGFRDELSLSLHMLFVGECDSAGSPFADGLEGLSTNMDEFENGTVDATEDSRGTVEAVYEWRDGSITTFRMQVDELRRGDGEPDKPCTLMVRIPSGAIARP